MPKTLDTQGAIGLLNQIMEAERAGVVRDTHHAMMVYGCGCIRLR